MQIKTAGMLYTIQCVGHVLGKAVMVAVINQTNPTIKERKKRFKLLPGHDHVAVVICPPALEELKLRLANRTGKDVSWKVLQRYINKWEPPTKDKGFKEIWVVPLLRGTVRRRRNKNICVMHVSPKSGLNK
jgi:guanylate kinase